MQYQKRYYHVERSQSRGRRPSLAPAPWLVHVPGLKVVAASNPVDAKGLLLSAIEDDDPVVLIESMAPRR